MNRGNLAEDPKAGLSSSSRYSRDGGEKNSLLYVDSSAVRKDRKAASRKAGSQAGTNKGDHNSKRKKSVGRGLADSHMDRLEVGSDGRLFQVKEHGSHPQGATASAEKAEKDIESSSRRAEADGNRPGDEGERVPEMNEIRPSITQKILAEPKKDRQQEQSSERVAKPDRSYLNQGNPLLSGSVAIVPRHGTGVFFRRFRVPIIAGVLAAAAAVYGYTAWHYRNRFYPGTEFFSIPAAEMSVYDVKAAVKAKVDAYSLQLITRKNDEAHDAGESRISAEDVAMTYRDNGEIDKAMKNQKVWVWPVMMLAQMLGEKNASLETTYDERLVTKALNQLPCMQKENMIAPEDAKVVLTDDGATVRTEIYGTTLDEEKTGEAVREALDTGATQIDLDSLGLYKNPKVFSSDLSLMTKAMAMNRVLGAKILLRCGNQTEVVNSEVIASFLDQKDGSYTLNEEKLRAYVSDLAQKYDTYQKKRDFYTSIGTKITLEEGMGDYGWLMDQEATYEELLEAVRSQRKTSMSAVWSQEAYCVGPNDIGDTYVEISLTHQTMWFYKNGRLVVETPVVTGNPYAGHETPSGGVWSLKGRMRNQTLSGQGYSTPVDYWMPFNGGVGIHDLQSRAWFGGSIYLGSGSHGCINTPLSAVKLIYDQIEEGVPVIVYKDESEEALALVTGPTDVQTANATIEENFGTVEDDGIGSVVAWSRAQRAQAAAWAAQSSSAGTTAS